MKYLFTIFLFYYLVSCQSKKIPTEPYSQYEYGSSYFYEKNELKIELSNPLNSPLRIWVQSPEKNLQSRFDKTNPIELGPLTDTLLTIPNIEETGSEIIFASRLGSMSKEIKKTKLELPFLEGKKYKVIQGNNSDYTHNTDWSRFAVDFNLKVNDTICSATDGFVVGVVDQYKFGGKEEKWNPFGNFVTIYEPTSGIFTQYVHLVQNGSLVQVGQQIKAGEPIALSGKTGQTDIEHLHFNCLVPSNDNKGLKSIPYEFIEGYKSEELKRNDMVVKIRKDKIDNN